MFQDYLLFASDVQTRYAFRVVHLSHLAQEAAKRHKLQGAKALILADTLTSGVLIASILETEDRVNLRIQCGSEFTVASETTSQAQTRGYIEWAEDSEVMARLENDRPSGASVIVRSLKSLPESNKLTEGITQSYFDTVEQVVNEHLDQSYQSNLKIRVESWYASENGDQSPEHLRAFGVIYLELPGLDAKVQSDLHRHIDSFTGFRAAGAKIDDPDQLAPLLIPDPMRPVNSLKPHWSCTCSLASVETMLMSLGSKELNELAASQESTEICCHYCKNNYTISPERLLALSISAAANAATAKPSNSDDFN
jgi:molecular chaperone Hsp33